jgi:hypothetical protein
MLNERSSAKLSVSINFMFGYYAKPADVPCYLSGVNADFGTLIYYVLPNNCVFHASF